MSQVQKASIQLSLSKDKYESQSGFDSSVTSGKRPGNPFKLPLATDVATFLQEEKRNKRLEHRQMSRLPLHKKTTFASRLGMMTSNVIETIPPVSLPKEAPLSPTSAIRHDPEFLRALSTGEKLRNMENISSFLNTKREMFLIQYLIGVKKDEMLKMEHRELDEEKKLSIAERVLEEDAMKFDHFLKQNDREAVDASKQAEIETKIKLDKVAEIKKIHVQIASIKSEISKLEDVLAEYKQYRQFLFNLSSPEWKENQIQEREIRKIAKGALKLAAATPGEKFEKKSPSSLRSNEVQRRSIRPHRSALVVPSRVGSGALSFHKMKTQQHKPSEKKYSDAQMLSDLQREGSSGSTLNDDSFMSASSSQYMLHDDDDDDDEVAIYFVHTQQLLDIFIDLEEMNLMMIQKSQETEEALEEVQAGFERTQKKMGSETNVLKAQIEALEEQIEREENRAEQFEIMSKMYSFGEFNEDVQEKMLSELNDRVESVYESVIGPNDANLSTLQMMTSIENKLEEILEIIDGLPPLKVETAVKLRDRQRRIMQRQEKLKLQQEVHLERLKRTIEKAMAVPLKHVGRRPVFRSAPPMPKQSSEKDKWRTKDDEELIYFFT